MDIFLKTVKSQSSEAIGKKCTNQVVQIWLELEIFHRLVYLNPNFIITEVNFLSQSPLQAAETSFRISQL